MAARSLLVAMFFVSLALAGCIGGDGGEDVGPADTNNNSDPNVVPPSGRGSIVAFEETNQTEEGVGGVDHHHDHWAGRERVVLFETSAQMAPIGSGNADSYQAVATFRPPHDPDSFTGVYEGTASVEFTIANPKRHYCEGEFTLGGYLVCTSNLGYHTGGLAPDVPPVDDPMGGPSGLKLRYKHASTVNWIDAGELTWGTPLSIKITDPVQTDMPHATASAWEFQVISPNHYDSTLTFDAKVEIIRAVGEDIPLWPGHPDFYVDSPYRKILDTKQAVACDTAGCQLGESTGPVHPDKLVSYETRTLYVWVNITNFQSADPVTKPDNWFLYHRNSTGEENSTNLFDKENHGIDKMEHFWILPVDDNGMDSPYADGSKWQFELGAAFYKEGLSCYGGCAAWSAQYAITVIASNLTEAPEKYEMFCIRADDYCPQPETSEGGESRHKTFEALAPDGRLEKYVQRF